MFRQNDDISWRIRTCSGVARGPTVAVPRQRPRISNPSEGGNTIVGFLPRHCLEGDRREIERDDMERCLENPPAYVAPPYFVSLASFSRTRLRRESLLRLRQIDLNTTGVSPRRALDSAGRSVPMQGGFHLSSWDGEARFPRSRLLVRAFCKDQRRGENLIAVRRIDHAGHAPTRRSADG